MSTKVAFSSSVSKAAKSKPASANAWSVGAKTVNGPSPCRAPTRPACDSAETRVSCTPVPWAFAGMSERESLFMPSAATMGDANRLAITSMANVAFLLLMRSPNYLPLLKGCLAFPNFRYKP